MIGETRLKQLHDFLNGYSKEELVWINGYLSGMVSASVQQTALTTKKITIAFGTESGNAKKLATQLVAAAKKKGIQMKLTSLDQYRLTDLPKEDYFFIVISTQGEGEPPLAAKPFYDYLHQSSLSLDHLKFSVLALGDSSYPLFCQTGIDVDAQFEKLGAKRIVPLQKCDVDFDDEANSWFQQLLALLALRANEQPILHSSVTAKKTVGKKIYDGQVSTNINLNDKGSAKQTFHIEIGTEEPLSYEPGDTIGIIPVNRKEVVDKIISFTGIDAAKIIATAKATDTVSELLRSHLNICYLLSTTIKKYAAIVGQEIPDTRMDLVDLLRIYPVKNVAQFEEVIGILNPIAPRLYSISSSPAAHGEYEVHITVAKNKFLAEEEQRFGLCSEFLGDLQIGATLRFYIHQSKNFKLAPAAKDIIMIGPGTGVAPFRSFLFERDHTGAQGRNWFFFGEQHFTTDFLYQREMQQLVETGVLTTIDLAFSRDQQEKIYVQHRMLQKAKELYQWIQNGAYVYVSGSKDPMSKEVENTIIQIIIAEGGKTFDEAKELVEFLKKEGRYQKDVY